MCCLSFGVSYQINNIYMKNKNYLLDKTENNPWLFERLSLQLLTSFIFVGMQFHRYNQYL